EPPGSTRNLGPRANFFHRKDPGQGAPHARSDRTTALPPASSVAVAVLPPPPGSGAPENGLGTWARVVTRALPGLRPRETSGFRRSPARLAGGSGPHPAALAY